MGLKSPERHRSSFTPIFAKCSRESDVDFNCISSGRELFEDIKLFIYYSFLFVCLLLKRLSKTNSSLVLSFSLVSVRHFFNDRVCLTF